jgi:hypothetical protein
MIGYGKISLCNLYVFFTHSPIITIRSLIRPAFVNGILAPTKQQRLEYATWLHVFGKDRTEMPSRMATLVDDYNVCIAYYSWRPPITTTDCPLPV